MDNQPNKSSDQPQDPTLPASSGQSGSAWSSAQPGVTPSPASQMPSSYQPNTQPAQQEPGIVQGTSSESWNTPTWPQPSQTWPQQPVIPTNPNLSQASPASSLAAPSLQTSDSVAPLSQQVPTWPPAETNQPIQTPQETTQAATANQSPFQPPVYPISQPKPAADMTEPAPTDLSQLSTITPETQQTEAPPSIIPPQDQPVPGAQTVIPQPVENQQARKLPKILLGVGIAVILLVAAGSAYFILGIGNPNFNQAPPNVSLPAEEAEETTEEPLITEPASSQAPTAPEANQPAAQTGSTSFGQLNGTSAGEGTTGTQPPSAADLIRQRQQQGQ